jgi:hypothetical protein
LCQGILLTRNFLNFLSVAGLISSISRDDINQVTQTVKTELQFHPRNLAFIQDGSSPKSTAGGVVTETETKLKVDGEEELKDGLGLGLLKAY